MRTLAALALLMPMSVEAAPLPADPLRSPMWAAVAKQAFGEGAIVRFDPRLKLRFPAIAENQRVFPVEVDARAIADVRRIVIIVDLNPIQLPIDFTVEAGDSFIATRVKLDQRTPVRAAVQLMDGSWLVSGSWIDAAGGGCSAPPVSRVKGDWAEHLGEVRGALWPQPDGAVRATLAFRHPMDTGFVENIAAYHLEDLVLTGADGRALGRVRMQAAVSEDPVITLMPHARVGEAVTFHARDTNGIAYRGTLRAAGSTR